MKRGFTLFLLALFLLNVLGYYGIFLSLQIKTGKEMRALFDDDNYQSEDELTINIPIAIPYGTETFEYTRVDGEFEHNGEIYRMVKQRYLDGALQIVCVKDHHSKKIRQVLSDIVKSFTDKPSSEKGSTKTLQNFIKDYISSSTSLEQSVPGWNNSILYTTYIPDYKSLKIQLNSPPPKA